MFAAGMVLGILIMAHGIYSLVSGRIPFRKSAIEKYTEDSLKVYSQLSGILHLLIGVNVLLLCLGGSTSLATVFGWVLFTFLWLAVATNITVYLIAPVKKVSA